MPFTVLQHFVENCLAHKPNYGLPPSQSDRPMLSIFESVHNTRWFRYESQTNQQPIRFTLDDKFAGPSYLTIRSSVYIILILDPYISNLYNLWQTRCIYIRRKPRQCELHFNEQITITHFLLLQPSVRPVPAQVILLWKGPPKLCIECHLVPLWAFPPKSPGTTAINTPSIKSVQKVYLFLYFR